MTSRRMVDRWEDDNKDFLKLSFKKHIYPTIYGAIIGDILGVPVEFKKRDTYRIEGITGYGTYSQPPGTWSDDTSLTLCLMENITEEGNMNSLMEKFVEYKTHGQYTPFGEMFDIGRTTIEAIENFEGGVAPEKCGGKSEFDNGNGAIMRIAPLVFLNYDEYELNKKLEFIENYTQITHRHPRSIVGSIILHEFLFRLYRNDAPKEALNVVKWLFDKYFDENHQYNEELKHYSRIFEANFFDTPRSDIQSSGYVVHTLEAAIWCLGNSSNFKEAVLTAVNLGEDTDTVGSITGALAGMYYKMDGIPQEWLNQIVKKDEIDERINNFYTYCANRAVLKEYGSL